MIFTFCEALMVAIAIIKVIHANYSQMPSKKLGGRSLGNGPRAGRNRSLMTFVVKKNHPLYPLFFKSDKLHCANKIGNLK